MDCVADESLRNAERAFEPVGGLRVQWLIRRGLEGEHHEFPLLVGDNLRHKVAAGAECHEWVSRGNGVSHDRCLGI